MMKESRLSFSRLFILFLVIAGLFYIIDNMLQFGNNASLMLSLLFWVAIAQGSVAVVATADITSGKWIRPFKRDLLSVYPMILLIAILFLVFIPKIDLYNWTHDPGVWLNKTFFVSREFLMILITYFLAQKFAKESMKESEKKNIYAVLYMFSFIISQTLIAFDWVMSLEYPWISTLFGGYFFVEAFFTALALGGIFIFVFKDRYLAEFGEDFEKARRDLATLLFGFSIFWAYIFFSQYLVIWYGNLPEEVSFLWRRVQTSPMKEFTYTILGVMFILPFITLLFRPMKNNYKVLFSISLVIWAGLFIERVIFLLPDLPLNPIILIVQFLIVGGILVYLVRNGARFLGEYLPAKQK